MGKVSIVRTGSNIKEALHRSLDLLGGIQKFFSAHDRVLLKPNLNDCESFTSRELTGALIELLRDVEVRDIFIAESTFGDARATHSHFLQTGYLALAEKYKIDIINLNNSIPVAVKVKNPLLLPELQIAAEVLSASKIVNLPVMKVHYATGVTLALKNLKGLLAREEKRHFHEAGLDKSIVDLNTSIKPDLNIIDCLSCMQGMGPKGGEIFNLNLLVAGESSGEVDYVASTLMGYSLEEIAHLKYFLKAAGIDPGAIRVVGEKLAEVVHPFKKVKMHKIVPRSVTIHDQGACSSCLNALLLSFRFLEKEITQPVHIFLGPGHRGKRSQNLSIGFGNCCLKSRAFTKTLKGCPPVPFELKNILE